LANDETAGQGEAPDEAARAAIDPAPRQALAAALRARMAGRDAEAGEGWDADLIDDADAGERRTLRQAAVDWLELWAKLKVADGAGRRVVAQLRAWEELRTLRSPLDLAEAIIRAYRGLGVARALELRAEKAASDWAASPLSERVIRRDLAAWRRTAKAVAEVGRLLALEGPDVPFDDFCRQVAEMLSAEELPPEGGSDPEETLLLSRLDARNLSFDVLFVAGMTADAAPGQRKVNVFFTEKERRLVGWTTREDEVAEWRHLAGTLLCAAPRQFWSWHGSPESPPSPLLREACEAFGVAWEEATAGSGLAPIEPPLSAREIALSWDQSATASAPSRRLAITSKSAGASAAPLARRRERVVRLLVPADGVEARLQAAKERDEPPDLSRHDGLVKIDAPALASMRRVAGGFSATACETYAACGWEAWARRLADLRPLPDFDATPHAQEHGRLVHRALAEGFLAARADLGAIVDDANPETVARLAAAFAQSLGEHRPSMLASLLREGEDFPEADSFWRGRVERWGRGLDLSPDALAATDPAAPAERPRGPLDNLAHVHRLAMPDFLPRFLEAGIGVSRGCQEILSDAPIALAVPGEREGEETAPLLVRGIVDRVDLVAAGGHVYAVVFDYKTGEPPSPDDIAAGYRFQLPLYLLAVAEGWAKERGILPGGAFYLGLNADRLVARGFAVPAVAAKLAGMRSSHPERSFEVDRPKIIATTEMDGFLGACAANAAAARAAALRGRFATSWRPKSYCGQCDYRRICRSDAETKAGWLKERRYRLGDLGFYDPRPAMATA